MLPAWRSPTNLFPAICKMAQTPPTKTPSCHLQPFQSLLISSSLPSPPSHANLEKDEKEKQESEEEEEAEEEGGEGGEVYQNYRCSFNLII